MSSAQKTIIKKQLLFLLRGGNAHTPIKRAINTFPGELINKRIENISYTPWQLLEHLRIVQHDIIQFILNSDYVAPKWPDDYWTELNENADKSKWKTSQEKFFSELDEMEKFIKDDSVDLFAPIPHSENYTIFREILVLASHNSYHIGQMMLIKKMFS